MPGAPQYPSVHPSIHPSIYLSLYLSISLQDPPNRGGRRHQGASPFYNHSKIHYVIYVEREGKRERERERREGGRERGREGEGEGEREWARKIRTCAHTTGISRTHLWTGTSALLPFHWFGVQGASLFWVDQYGPEYGAFKTLSPGGNPEFYG